MASRIHTIPNTHFPEKNPGNVFPKIYSPKSTIFRIYFLNPQFSEYVICKIIHSHQRYYYHFTTVNHKSEILANSGRVKLSCHIPLTLLYFSIISKINWKTFFLLQKIVLSPEMHFLEKFREIIPGKIRFRDDIFGKLRVREIIEFSGKCVWEKRV